MDVAFLIGTAVLVVATLGMVIGCEKLGVRK